MDLKQETSYVIEYHKLEELIKKVYGKEFSVISDMEAQNDSVHQMSVDGVALTDKYDLTRFNEWVNYNKEGFITNLIMQDLCSKGHLPPGKYLLKISW